MTLGDKIPKTYQTFEKHKTRNDENYKAWQREYRWENKRLSFQPLIGQRTATGIEITGISRHVVDQAINRGFTAEGALDALQNPVDVGKMKTDAQGRKVDFKQTIIIMTSNAGAQMIMEPKHLGFMSGDTEKRDYERMKSGVMEEVRRMFKPEFLNRIDEIMVFHSLNKENIRKIVTILLKNLEKRCQEQLDIILKVTGAAKDLIADAGFDSKYGARPLRRAIQTKIEDEMATEILEGRIKAGDTVQVKVKDKKIYFEVKDAEKA